MSDLSIPQAEQEKGVLEHVLLVDDNPVSLKILYKSMITNNKLLEHSRWI